MIFFKKIFTGIIVFLCLITCAIAQTKFSAVITPSQIAKDEYATLRIEITNATDVKNLTLPLFKDFIVVSGPNHENGMSNINGAVTQYRAISYILQPRKTGKLILNPATVRIDGKQYSSSPLKLLVTNKTGNSPQSNAAANPFAALDPFAPQSSTVEFNDFILKKGEDVHEKVNKSMQLKLNTSKSSCYVGQPIVASYQLYSRLRSESKLTKNPSFNGFSVIDLMQSDVTDYAREKLNGREYNVYTIRKAQLYPLQAGTFELESATLDNNIQFLKEETLDINSNVDGFINGSMMNPDAIVTQSVSLSSKPVSIVVKPLPEEGRPATFTGAVGKFKMKSTLEKNTFSTDETSKLILELSGQGNLQLITAPEINWPKQIEVFESKLIDELILLDVPVSGKKIYEIPFTVQLEGSYTIPEIEFSFFDPATATYKTIKTTPIRFNVQKGYGKPAMLPDTSSNKIEKSFAGKMFEHRTWLVGLFALLLALGLYFWFWYEGKKQKKSLPVPAMRQVEEIQSLKQEEMGIVQQNPFELSLNCLNSTNKLAFYTLLNQDLKVFIAKQFSLKLPEVNPKTVSVLMDKAGFDNTLSIQMQQLMEEIDWKLYTPFEENNHAEEIYNKAQAIVQAIIANKNITP